MTSPAPWLDMRNRITASGIFAADRIAWPNESFTRPDASLGAAAMHLVVQDHGEGNAPIEMGGNGEWQERGEFIFLILLPQYQDTIAARTAGKAITDLFRQANAGYTSPIVYYASSSGSGQPDEDDDNWWAYPVTVSYRYQDRPA